MPTTNPIAPEPRRFSIRLPRPLWIGLASVLLIVAVAGLPAYRQYVAVREIERLGGRVLSTQPRGPKWLRHCVGNRLMMWLFDDIVCFRLVDSQTTDATLSHIGRLRSLQQLLLDNTQVTDRGLAHLKGLTGLQQLSLDNTQVTDRGLAHLKGLTGLQLLSCANTQVTDAGLAQLNLSKLESLALENTPVTDALLAHLKGATRLEGLWLDNTQVTDAGLAHLKGLTSLDWLSLDNTPVSDAGLAHLKGFTGLSIHRTREFPDKRRLVFLQYLGLPLNLSLVNTQVTDAGVADLQLALPGVMIRRFAGQQRLPSSY